MKTIVVGSMALDSVKTSAGEVKNVLGGSATYFACAASLFTNIGIVSAVGEDFPKKHLDMLKKRGVDISGVKICNGKTFRWSGHYGDNLNEATTLSVSQNVLGDFVPDLPDKYKKAKYVFLANIDPEIQLRVFEQIASPTLVVCDTMNLWINTSKPKLLTLLRKVDVLILNNTEANMLTGKQNSINAMEEIFKLGPTTVIIKKGEHGAIFGNQKSFFAVPAFPLKKVCDPTGAGDSFGGGFMGHLASTGDICEKNMRKAVVYGSIMASFAVGDFSVNNLKRVTKKDVETRFRQFMNIVSF